MKVGSRKKAKKRITKKNSPKKSLLGTSTRHSHAMKKNISLCKSQLMASMTSLRKKTLAVGSQQKLELEIGDNGASTRKQRGDDVNMVEASLVDGVDFLEVEHPEFQGRRE